jgi:hypothetical protein
MTPCPAIATYRLSSGPLVALWLARYVVGKRDKAGALSYGFLPMCFDATTEDDAREAAQSFWASWQATIEARVGRMAAVNDARKRRVKEGSA